MSDIIIGNSGGLPPGSLKEITAESVMVSGKRIGQFDSNSSGVIHEERIIVEINLYSIEKDRVKIEIDKITFTDVLNAVNDIDGLNTLYDEIKGQIDNINNGKTNTEIEDFSLGCIQEIEEKINKIINHPKGNEQAVLEKNNFNPTGETTKIPFSLNNTTVITRYITKVINNKMYCPLSRKYIDDKIKELPVSSKISVHSKKAKLSLMNSGKQVVAATTLTSQNPSQKKIIATVNMRFFQHKNIPKCIDERSVKKSQEAGSIARFSSVSTGKKEPSTMGSNATVSSKADATVSDSSISTKRNKAALSENGGDIIVNNSDVMADKSLEKQHPLNNSQPSLPIMHNPSIHPFIAAQSNLQLSKEAIISKNKPDKAASERQILQQIIDDLNDLENLFSEENGDVNKKDLLTFEYLEGKLRSSIKKFIQQQLIRGDPCQSEEIINNKLKAVRALKDRLEQGQKTANVNKALDLLQDSIRDLTESWEKTSEACRKRKIALSTNFI